MIVVIPFCEKDAQSAVNLVKWIDLLGGCETDCLLVTDAATQWSTCAELISLATGAFLKADLITTDSPVVGWKRGANALWLLAAEEARKRNVSWLFLEPDAVPLKQGWFDAIAAEYASTSKPYMGYIYAGKVPGLPQKFMTGVAVYPASAYDDIGFHARGDESWDVTAAKYMVEHGEDTNLIFQIWGEEGKPPTFAKQNVPHTNIICLDQIHANAVLFHRNKDGTLIDLLKEKLFPNSTDFIVVLPFCNHDGRLMLKNVQWMAQLDRRRKYDCLMSYEDKVSQSIVDSIRRSAQLCFGNVFECSYPSLGRSGWPQGPNWAIQCTARFIQQNIKQPWLWMEYDQIPVTRDWIDVLQHEYKTCGKPYMGNVILDFGGHMNGGGVYPWDFPIRSPLSMAAKDVAWDYFARSDIIPYCHPANHLIQQCTGIVNGRCVINGGADPAFRTKADVMSLLQDGAVVFHRCKDGSLINRLKEMVGHDSRV